MVTVDAKGRIVLPKDLRERLGLDPGTEVDVHEEDGRAVVEPEVDPEQVIERLDALVADAAENRGAPADEMHPIAVQHADAIRRQAGADATDE